MNDIEKSSNSIGVSALEPIPLNMLIIILVLQLSGEELSV